MLLTPSVQSGWFLGPRTVLALKGRDDLLSPVDQHVILGPQRFV